MSGVTVGEGADGGEKVVTRPRPRVASDGSSKGKMSDGRDVGDSSLMTAGGFKVIVRPSWD